MIIIIPDIADENNELYNLVGHSLSWSNQKPANQTAENRFTAKIWTPQVPTESDILTLSSYDDEQDAV